MPVEHWARRWDAAIKWLDYCVSSTKNKQLGLTQYRGVTGISGVQARMPAHLILRKPYIAQTHTSDVAITDIDKLISACSSAPISAAMTLMS